MLRRRTQWGGGGGCSITPIAFQSSKTHLLNPVNDGYHTPPPPLLPTQEHSGNKPIRPTVTGKVTQSQAYPRLKIGPLHMTLWRPPQLRSIFTFKKKKPIKWELKQQLSRKFKPNTEQKWRWGWKPQLPSSPLTAACIRLSQSERPG